MGDWILFALCALVGGGLAAVALGLIGKIAAGVRVLLGLVVVALFGVILFYALVDMLVSGKSLGSAKGYLFGVLVSVVTRVEVYFKGRAVASGISDKKAGVIFWAGSVVAIALLTSALGIFSHGDVTKNEKPKPAAQVVQVQQVTEKPAAVDSCECDAGAVCTGPKGGKYCIGKNGNKKYL